MTDGQDDVEVISRDIIRCLSTFTVRSKRVAQVMEARGFVLAKTDEKGYHLKATGKWSHRRTRRVVHKIMQSCSPNPLLQAQAILERREEEVELASKLVLGYKDL